MSIPEAYVAGLFDGEGSISINKTQGRTGLRYALRVTIANKHTGVLNIIQAEIGGSIQSVGHDCYQLIFTDAVAQAFLERMHVYCIIKEPQIELALAFRKCMRKHHSNTRIPLSQEEIEERQWFKEELERINEQGQN